MNMNMNIWIKLEPSHLNGGGYLKPYLLHKCVFSA